MAKKIGAIVSLSIIGVLILATIIMANVNVDYQVKCERPNYIYVQFEDNGERGAKTQQVDEILNFINNASKEKSLTALFNGRLNEKASIVTEKGTVPSTDGSFYIRYHYDQKQDLKEGNKVFKDGDGNTYQYTDLTFAVNNVEGETLTKVYVIPDSTKVSTYSHYYLLEADFEGLYDYLTSNFGNLA